MVPNRPFHTPTVSRRQILLTTGTFIAGGGVVAAAGSEPASGSIDTRELQIPPAEHTGEDGSVSNVDLEVWGNYQFDAGAADTIVLALSVAPDGDQSNFQTIDETEQSASAASGAGQYTLAGSILDHDALEAQQFSAEPEEVVSHDLPVRVTMDVRHDGESVVQSMAETRAAVTVENSSVRAEASVLGDGEIATEF